MLELCAWYINTTPRQLTPTQPSRYTSQRRFLIHEDHSHRYRDHRHYHQTRPGWTILVSTRTPLQLCLLLPKLILPTRRSGHRQQYQLLRTSSTPIPPHWCHSICPQSLEFVSINITTIFTTLSNLIHTPVKLLSSCLRWSSSSIDKYSPL